MSSKKVMLAQLIAVVVWGVLGTILGVAGVFASSHIPFIILGWIFGAVGASIHILLLAFDKHFMFWKVGCLITVISGAITVVWAPIVVSQLVIPLYFIFGCLIYTGVDRLFDFEWWLS